MFLFLGSKPPPQIPTLPPIPPMIFTTNLDTEYPQDSTENEKEPLADIQTCDCSTASTTMTTEASSNTTQTSTTTSTTTTTTTTTMTTTTTTTTTTITTSWYNTKYCSEPENSVPLRIVCIKAFYHNRS